eukprot:CAMPEP_0172317940 /NCGR_PEP_ID=MMETSP1058-20130122/33356_1 /TAXON_ID=83371 /ORGANISM="Detonula confervacea, Strain CCMP 353" /LENGTH=70 /DNA_ID=CAMNT_0013032629 /DNA_START=594 /DNA_END=806 /DNA_ORIENTATION=-
MPISKQPPAISGGWCFTTMEAELRLLLQPDDSFLEWSTFLLGWIVGTTLEHAERERITTVLSTAAGLCSY